MTKPSDDVELPRAVALAWGVAAHPQRGPKRELSIERIVETAMEIADEGGLVAVSMAAVAGRLGFTPMSLYRYVSAKDDLMLLMQETAIGVPPASLAEVEGWRPAMEAWADATAQSYERHPWLLDIPIAGTPVAPNNLAWLDGALGALRATPLEHAEKLAVCLAMLAQVRMRSQVHHGYTQAAESAGTSPDALDDTSDRILHHLVTAEAFPWLSQAIEAGAFSPESVTDPFAFGLTRLLDGVQRYIEAGGSGTAPSPAPAVLAPDDDAIRADKGVREADKAVREARKALRDAGKGVRDAEKSLREATTRARAARERVRTRLTEG